MNILYLGLDNPITVAAFDIKLNSVSLATSNGTVTGEKGHYYIRPETLGTADLAVWTKAAKGKKKVGGAVFRVKSIPDPIVKLDNKTGGNISKQITGHLIAPYASFSVLGYCATFQIDSFTLIIMRDRKLLVMKDIYHTDGDAARFSDDSEAQATMAQLNAGDNLILCNITCHGYDKTFRHLQPVEYMITE